MWPRVSSRAFGLGVLLAAVATGCGEKSNPLYCDAQKACAAGLTCVRSRCIAADAGMDADAPMDGDAADRPMDPPAEPVGCTTEAQCTATGTPFCRGSVCVACAAAGAGACAMRSPATPVCASSGACVVCEMDAQCSAAGTSFCKDNTCVGCAAAGMNACSMRTPTTPVCTGAGTCVECEMDAQCTDAGKSFCRATACVGCAAAGAGACGMRSPAAPVCAPDGTCAECVASSDCAAAGKPICQAQTCVACTSDAECAAKGGGPGVCMVHQDGRCASEAETIYVEDKTGCSDAGTGTASAPLCTLQLAQGQLAPARRVVVVSGAVLGLVLTASGAPVTLVGQSAGAIAPGTKAGIHASGAGLDLYVRDLTVRNSDDTGVIADAGATIRLDRVILQNNAKGGLRVAAGAGFDVVNSIFVGNGPGAVGPTFFGGAYLGAGGPATRFRFTTLVNNMNTGVVCENASQGISSLLLSGNVGADHGNCTLTSSKTTADGPAMLTPTHRLTAASPCRDAVPLGAPDAPAYDIDGEGRPQGPALDCGADEYVP